MNLFLRIGLLCGFAATAAFSQSTGAGLQGSVADPSGAVIPRATVEVLNGDTGPRRMLLTDEGGRWREPVLPPGEYQIKVTSPGFQTVLRKGIHLAVGQDAVVDIQLALGRNDTTVSVIAEAPRVNLTSGSSSGLVDERQMRDLPLNGRSFQQLALLQPGVNAVNAGGSDPVGGRTPKISSTVTTSRQVQLGLKVVF